MAFKKLNYVTNGTNINLDVAYAAITSVRIDRWEDGTFGGVAIFNIQSSSKNFAIQYKPLEQVVFNFEGCKSNSNLIEEIYKLAKNGTHQGGEFNQETGEYEYKDIPNFFHDWEDAIED